VRNGVAISSQVWANFMGCSENSEL
jgi:hypothetical protein